MNANEKTAIRDFVSFWTGKGDEKGESQKFWLSLLSLLGVENPERFVEFEDRVFLGHASFIDAYIPETKVLIEQKKATADLNAPIKQSDGSKLTPFQQAKRYATELPYSRRPRWIVVCNFAEFVVYDMERPTGEPETIFLNDLEKELYRLKFLVDSENARLKRETEVSIKAGDLVGVLYDKLIERYKDPNNPESLRSLNMLCVRLVFCLYAEDAGVFGVRNMFHDYMKQYDVPSFRKALIELFQVLDQTPEERDPYLRPDLAAFPYVNGGLFSDESIEIPNFTDEIRTILLSKASEDFDWSEISPTIFGAVFESTLNPETRRSGGMHYTSIENIHKAIDPLFLDELRAELDAIKSEKVLNARIKKARAFQERLGKLKFLDPACGSGNFLTETFLSLRRLENEAISIIFREQGVFGEVVDPVKVSIDQFFGIEINDFAVTVAKTALWIAENQTLVETARIIHKEIEFLPLKTNAKIIEANALRIDWEDVAPKSELTYIMGNPPFVGYGLQTKEQSADVASVYVDEKGKTYKSSGKIDYVACWYFKAAQYIQNTNVRVAFVSTNSITQGEQTALVWKPLYERFNVHIDFAYRTFRWDSEANEMAHVHCVIIGFSVAPFNKPRKILDGDKTYLAKSINFYLIDAPIVFVEPRSKPIYDVPSVQSGNRPTDGGHLIIEADEIDDFLKREPSSRQYIKKLVGAKEYINNLDRYCLWLVGVSPTELRKMPLVMERVKLVRETRLASPDEGARKLAETPSLFRETNNPNTYIVIPRHSSERRQYIPFGFLDSNTIPTDATHIVPNATLYHFGVLTSSVHMAWTRAVCGRLEMRYRYSNKVVYNNFPWPKAEELERGKIERTAQAILDARALYPDSSLADLYDEATMPKELRAAHKANDAAVFAAYRFPEGLGLDDEPGIVAELMRRYKELTERA
ncbi:MAG: class I SAM-dependent DNA methyltransferase [Thermoguttaceae bacterium]|nr:class I SAM-dependent DNA methyltransferase [Thermoguttaceae bacterium]